MDEDDTEPRFERFPAWMFCQPFINKIATRYRVSLKAYLGRPSNSNLHETGDMPEFSDVILALNNKWIWHVNPPGKHNRPLKPADPAARVRTAAQEAGWSIVIGHRLRLFSIFTGLKYTTFAQEHGWTTQGQKTQFMSRIATGEADVTIAHLQAVENRYGISAKWFSSDDIFVPLQVKYKKSVLDDRRIWQVLKPEETRSVVHGDVWLKDLHVETGLPSWTDPYVVFANCIYFHDIFPGTPIPDDLRFVDPPHFDTPPDKIPQCHWDGLLADAGIESSNTINDKVPLQVKEKPE